MKPFPGLSVVANSCLNLRAAFFFRVTSLTPIRWHDSMYYEGSYFWQLFHDTQVYTRRSTSIYCGSPAR